MEEIIIPSCKDIELATMDTVDKFASLAEALSVPVVVQQKEESFLSVSVHVLKIISKQTTDIGKLFAILERLTMAIVSDKLTNADQLKPSSRLPSLTRLQKQAVDFPIKTIDDEFKFEIESKTNQIRLLVKEHKTMLEKCRAAQRDCWKAEAKLKQAKLTLLTAQKSREYLAQSGKLSEKEKNLRDKTISELEVQVTSKENHLDDTNFSYEKCVGYELTVRDSLQQLSRELVHDIRYKIKERLTYGMECLQNVIKEHLDGERRDDCLQLISGVNIKNNVATCLMRSTSRKYVCPDIREYNTQYGFKSALPAGSVIDATEIVEVLDKDIWKQLSLTSLNGDNRQTNSLTSITNMDKPLLTFSDITMGSQKVNAPTYTGIVQKSKSDLTVTALHESSTNLPGLLKIKKGMKIKQKLIMSDIDIAFGCYRPGLFSSKVWGFYLHNQTQVR